MTTTGIPETYQFNASIKSKGQQRSGDGWTITFDWMLPGSKYPLILYGKDWHDVDGWEVGDTADVGISKGGLKSNKDGKYQSDYFWDLASIEESSGRQPAPHEKRSAPASDDDRGPGRYTDDEPPPQNTQRARTDKPDYIQTRIEIGMVFNAAYTFMTSTKWTGTPFSSINLRELRDTIYHQVIQVTVAPEHYCYPPRDGA